MKKAISAPIVYQHQAPLITPLIHVFNPFRKGIKLGQKLPPLKASIKSCKALKMNLEKYLKVTFQEKKVGLPVCYPHVMAGVGHLNILTHPNFPLNLLGAVHTQNKILQYRSLDKNASYDLEFELGKERFYEKFVEFDLHTKMYLKDVLVWEEISTYRQSGKYKVTEQETPPLQLETLTNFEEFTRWRLDPMLGKNYAMISKDFNPIHISKGLAKIWGHKRDLAHGMCIVAQAISKLNSPQTLLPFGVEAIFKGPCYLGGTVKMVRSIDDVSRFDLYIGDNPRPVICLKLT